MTSNMGIKVPFFDLKRQTESIKGELEAAFEKTVSTASYILGESVEKLERQISEFVGADFAVGVASGTDALMLAYQSLGIKPGDGVITTPFTFFATAGAVFRLGARPFFVDIEPETFNIDTESICEFIENECDNSGSSCIHKLSGAQIKGIVPVHLFGQMAKMSEVIELAEKYGLFIVEDAAQAIGAYQTIAEKKTMAGSIGSAAAFSFYPTKNLGAMGDGGMVTTSNPEIAKKIKSLRVHGIDPDDTIREVGSCSRLDGIQAAFLSVKFNHLKEYNRRRYEIARKYIEYIQSYPELNEIVLPVIADKNNHTWHQFVIRTPKRDGLLKHLIDCGIGNNVYYRLPNHLQPVSRSLGYKLGDLPKTEKASQEVLALPIWPEIKDEEIEEVVKALRLFYDK